MSNQVNSVGSVGSTTSTASTSSSTSSSTTQALTQATKMELESLGVDTTNITSEMEGQIALLKAQQEKSAETSKAENKGDKGDKAEMESIKAQATSLASQLNVSVSSTDKVDDILANISSAIDNLRQQAGTDEAKLAQVNSYQSEYDSITGAISSMQSQKQAPTSQLTGSLNQLASSNQQYHKLG